MLMYSTKWKSDMKLLRQAETKWGERRMRDKERAEGHKVLQDTPISRGKSTTNLTKRLVGFL